jgi:hypothetical protein
MQNGKCPSPDGFTVELHKAFYDLVKNDLLLVVRESQREGRFYGPLNSTFSCLISKKRTQNILRIIGQYHATT